MSSRHGLSPWSDSNELNEVFESIYQNMDLIDLDYNQLVFAKNKITVWLTRVYDNIDVFVNLMATKEIINALIEDKTNADRVDQMDDESAVYSLYALSVVRFCSAISQYSHEDNMKSVRRLAHRYSCPQWVIDCRHSLCHSSTNQPSIRELRTAALIGLNWLRQYFWLKYLQCLNVRHNKNCDYYELIERYVNKDIKTVKKTKNEMIFGVKYSTNEFISSFIQHLVNNNEKPLNFERLKVKNIYLRKFSKIFAIIINNNCLPIVLNLMVRYFDCEDQCRRHLAMSWFTAIINAIKSDKKISRFRRNFKSLTFFSVMPKIHWIRLLYAIVKRPNPYTPVLIQTIAPIVCGVISDEKIEILINLCKHYSLKTFNETIDSNDKHLDQEFNVKKVEDLMPSTGPQIKSDVVIDWSEISFGASITLPSDPLLMDIDIN